MKLFLMMSYDAIWSGGGGGGGEGERGGMVDVEYVVVVELFFVREVSCVLGFFLLCVFK